MFCKSYTANWRIESAVLDHCVRRCCSNVFWNSVVTDEFTGILQVKYLEMFIIFCFGKYEDIDWNCLPSLAEGKRLNVDPAAQGLVDSN